MEQPKDITYWIDHFMQKFPEVTEEETDKIYEILLWDDEKRAGFFLAKKLFEREE